MGIFTDRQEATCFFPNNNPQPIVHDFLKVGSSQKKVLTYQNGFQHSRGLQITLKYLY